MQTHITISALKCELKASFMTTVKNHLGLSCTDTEKKLLRDWQTALDFIDDIERSCETEARLNWVLMKANIDEVTGSTNEIIRVCAKIS
jgi:hypothetical protein